YAATRPDTPEPTTATREFAGSGERGTEIMSGIRRGGRGGWVRPARGGGPAVEPTVLRRNYRPIAVVSSRYPGDMTDATSTPEALALREVIDARRDELRSEERRVGTVCGPAT